MRVHETVLPQAAALGAAVMPMRRRGREDMRLIVAACLAAALLFAAGLAAFDTSGHGHRPRRADGGILPGVTLDADLDPTLKLPLVVTSLRSQGAAWREGVRVGDRLEAVDGVPVPGRAALLRVLAQDQARVILLRLRRVGGTVDVRLDRGHGAGHDDP